MEKEYLEDLIGKLTEKDNLKLVREEAVKLYNTSSAEECWNTAMQLWESEFFQIQEIGVFLLGYLSSESPQALEFLKNQVSRHPDWRVQEVLAMAFDSFCKANGYEKSLPVIEEWFHCENANNRRAVSEGLRIWTGRPYFKENPQKAISILSSHKDDESEYVRKSVGNALRDISKKFPDLISAELSSWNTASKPVMQVYKLAGKFVK